MPDDAATIFIEWVYANPGLPATDYAVKLSDEMRELIKAEREACAKIAEATPPLTGPTHGAWDRAYVDGRRAAAAAIRSRSA